MQTSLSRGRVFAAAFVGAMLLNACASGPKTLVVVVPDADGKVGTVALTAEGRETVIRTPFAAARSQHGATTETMTLDETRVQSTFAAARAARPDRPVSYTLYFLEGSDELTQESRQNLPVILAELGRRTVGDIDVVGHTDRVGRVDYNDRLSLQRAQRVVLELSAIGIPLAQIGASGRGEREPLIATEDEVPEPRNRRVVVYVR